MARLTLSATGGAGDTLCALWVAAGQRAAGNDVGFFTNYLPAAHLFWPDARPLAEAPPGTVNLFRHGGGWAADNVATLTAPRIEVYARKLAPYAPPVRPAVAGPLPDAPAWASGAVVIWPWATHRQRMAPMHTWARLAQLLTAQGVRVAVACPPERTAEAATYGLPAQVPDGWAGMAAAATAAALNVTVDSGPLHLCGCLGAPTLAMLTQHRPASLLTHYPTATAYAPTAAPCLGCHFLPDRGYTRRPCGGQCPELWATSPGCLADAILDRLRTTGRAAAHARSYDQPTPAP